MPAGCADDEAWKGAPPLPDLEPDEVHLWRIPLAHDPRTAGKRALLLSGDERERMSRFRFDVHRERFALRRSALRVVLGWYLDLDPKEIEFRHSARGKPEVDRGWAGRRLRFNLSDSEDLAILGVTLDDDLGVDVERLRTIPDLDGLARRYFSPLEQADYFGLPSSDKLAGFYNCWTRKEAWLKAKGDGLSVDLRGFDVTLAPGLAPRLLGVRGSPAEPQGWSFHACEPQRGFVAAVAVQRERSRLVRLAF